jgi:periplasmic divalent cation tolerance protein
VTEEQYCVVFITTDGEEEGKRVADELLQAKLVACVNVVPRVSSSFWWQGKIDSATESLLVAKTKRSALEEIGRVVRAAHSYDVPEIIALPIVWGSQSYLDWIEEQVSA